ncbi:MAG: GAF domain-containing protein [Oligoflexales bacterium]
MDELISEIEGLMTGYWLTDLANFSALIYHRLPDLNWAGFYLFDGKTLRLGPFSGKPACTEIAPTRGVCGAAFSKTEIMIVDDVHSFEGHIACDPDSRSEMVIPFKVENNLIGVLDIDSPVVSRFTSQDASLLSAGLVILARRNPKLKSFPTLSP